ncbi:hypothetical protein FACS1894107_15870 [Planctomycetales bacterium]|nr:hypothetical protein FACS1894107_15870 [Planctomycetales bacterium]GHT01200.1 hypothetical protein FACS1894108_14640 [Planctomycetales bacterium]
MRPYGWALAGVTLIAFICGKRFSGRNAVAALRGLRLLAVELYTGAMNAARFELWLAKTLMPQLRPGDVIIMDNARFHRPRALRRLVRGRGLRIIFLPPYSPDLNPIEQVWANRKRQLRSIMPRQKFATLIHALKFVFKVK